MTQNKHHSVCIAGNPNCGKTTLFNALTGSAQVVGNWPGVTVEKKSGEFKIGGELYELTDLPGTYSLTPSDASGEDEQVARDYLLSGEPELVINIADASNLERNLYLTAQLTEMRIPMVLALNMADIARREKIVTDTERLSELLGCPVIPLEANRGEGLAELKDAVSRLISEKSLPREITRYPENVLTAAENVSALLSETGFASCRRDALQVLEGVMPKGENAGIFKEKYDSLRAEAPELFSDSDIAVSGARYEAAGMLCEECLQREGEIGRTLSDRIDRVVLNRWLGVPIFLAVMYLMFVFTMNIGGAFIDFFDTLFGGVFVEGFGRLLSAAGAPDWLRVLLADGAGGGIQTVSTFVPVIFCLFLFLSVLEDSGYMARAAFVMDRFMRSVGLPGRAFIPLLVGFGCGVPAVMGTRTMSRESDRIMTVLMVPFMSCGARLPVYVLFGAAFFAGSGSLLVFGLYMIGIAAAVLTAWLLKRNAFPGENAAFIMEIPPYHLPTLSGVWRNTWTRLKSFITRAGTVITGVVVIITFLNSVGTDGTFGHEDSSESVLSAVGKTIVPAFGPMGIEPENWPASVGVFTGILAKESVIGSLNSLYAAKAAEENGKAEEAEEEAEEPWSFTGILSEAAGTVKENFSGMGGALLQPLTAGEVGDLADIEEAAERAESDMTTVEMMQKLFGSKAAAFAYLLMVLLYMPCCAAIGAIWRELGTKWTVFACVWTTGVGYSAATVFYQISTFGQHPEYSLLCMACCAVFFAAMIVWMRLSRDRALKREPRVIPIRSV